MKKTHIVGLIAIAISAAVLLSMSGSFSTYSTFETAMEQPEDNHQIVGHLSPNKTVDYDPTVDPNAFYFYMKDESGTEQRVKVLKPKPQDFERSEQVVLTGKMQGDVFVAHDIQLKCPSKYQDEMIQSTKKTGEKASASAY